MKCKNTLLLLVGLLSLPAMAQTSGEYPINFPQDQSYTTTYGRYLGGIMLSSGDGEQSFSIDEPRKVYTSLLDKSFKARVGEQVTASFNYTGNWMNGFIYLDQGKDGSFNATVNSNGTCPSTSDIMAYSYGEPTLGGTGYNSNGTRLSGDGSNVLNPPSFTIPSTLAPGYYRMRYKVDWASLDPAGRVDASNSILTNGGAICDIRINVHGDYCNISTTATGGEVLSTSGASLNGTQVAFGQPLTIKLDPAEGYACDGLNIRHGYNLSGERLVYGTLQYDDVVIPGYLIDNGEYTIPAEYMDGEVRIEAIFRETGNTDSGNDYPYLGTEGTLSASLSYIVGEFTVSATHGGTTEVIIPNSLQRYRNLTNRQVSVVPGDEVTVRAFDRNGTELGNGNQLYLYVDLNQDGQFTSALNTNGTPTLSGELLSYNNYNDKNSLGASVTTALPTFTIPALLPTGVYRARLVSGATAIDPTGATGAPTTTTDFLINIHNTTHQLKVLSQNGSVNGSGVSGLPEQVNCYQEITLVPQPAADGYEAQSMTIRHGHNLNGPQYVHGNCQWSEYSVSADEAYTMPQDSVNGDIIVTVDFQPTAAAEYQLVFSDEFDAADGSSPDSNKWIRCTRYSSTWNRWLAKTEEGYKLTGFIEDGNFVARALPNPFTATDNVPMITGGIKSMGKFAFTYGKVECRLRTNPWSGNFPALWMMPENQSDGWPDCGEIDIWESINTETTSYHTIHTNWTFDLGNKTNPVSSYTMSARQDYYHTYTFEWDETSLTWYVDGVFVGSYPKSTSSSVLNQGQWPYDKHFHLILNQSVGDGSWAYAADQSHTYETKFDWVRVYQKEGQSNAGTSAIETPRTVDFNWNVAQGVIRLSTEQPLMVTIVDLSGRVVWSNLVDGFAEVQIQRGFYIVNGKKVLVP